MVSMENNNFQDPFKAQGPAKPEQITISTAVAKLQLPQDVALDLASRFEPFERQAKEWEAKAKALVVTDISQTNLMNEAREARLALRRIRLDVTKQHEIEKADALRKGQVLDLIKRTLVGYIEPLESHLQAQEDFAKVQEEKRKQALLVERMEALKPYRTPGDRLELVPFGEMDDGAFETFIMGLKASKELREAKAKEDERLRQEAEQKAKDEREKQRQENEKLKKINARSQRLTAIGFQWNEEKKGYIINVGHELMISEIEDTTDQQFNAEVAKAHTIIQAWQLKKQEQANQLAAMLKEETEAREKLEQEKREREEKEEKERKEKAAADRKLKRAPDKQKLLNFAERIEILEPITLKDDVAKAIYTNAVERLAQLVKDIKLQCEQL